MAGWRNGNALVSGSEIARDSGFESQACRFLLFSNGSREL